MQQIKIIEEGFEKYWRAILGLILLIFWLCTFLKLGYFSYLLGGIGMLFLGSHFKSWRVIVGTISVFIVVSLFFWGNGNDDGVTLFGVLAAILIFSLIISYFFNFFRRTRKKSEAPVGGQITTIIRIFLFLVCLFLVGLSLFVAYTGKGQSEPYAAIGALMIFGVFLVVSVLWWFFEFISLILKLIRKQKSSKFQIIFVLILPSIFIIYVIFQFMH